MEATLWNGVCDGIEGERLRRRDESGNSLLADAEQTQKERERAEKGTRAGRLAAELRKLGVGPDKI